MTTTATLAIIFVGILGVAIITKYLASTEYDEACHKDNEFKTSNSIDAAGTPKQFGIWLLKTGMYKCNNIKRKLCRK
jgi:hypothetical protein